MRFHSQDKFEIFVYATSPPDHPGFLSQVLPLLLLLLLLLLLVNTVTLTTTAILIIIIPINTILLTTTPSSPPSSYHHPSQPLHCPPYNHTIILLTTTPLSSSSQPHHSIITIQAMQGVDWRKKIELSVGSDHFYDTSNLDVWATARLIHSHGIHILINWDGYRWLIVDLPC